jgi:tRNA-2-methylthio-N6-dimethylallyladenosine synthase
LDFSEELIDCYGSVSKLALHLHLPVQSGSNEVLQKMGRHHRIDHYSLQMDRLKSLCPEIGLSTDIIVGFPSETEEDFEKTLDLLRHLQFDQVYAFAYSPRPGTRASKWEDSIPLEVKKKRLAALLKLQEGISSANHARWIGKTVEVLVEGEAKRQHLLQGETSEKVWVGKTTCNRTVHFVSEDFWTGRWAQVHLLGASAFSLQGEVLL